MKRGLFWILFSAVSLCGADDPWTRVQALKSGTELRVYRQGVKEPLLATLDEAGEERLLVVTKSSQMAVAKADIERLDARPPATPRKSTRVTTTKTVDPDYTPKPPGGVPVPRTSQSTSVTLSGGKGDFETVYRRATALPGK